MTPERYERHLHKQRLMQSCTAQHPRRRWTQLAPTIGEIARGPGVSWPSHRPDQVDRRTRPTLTLVIELRDCAVLAAALSWSPTCRLPVLFRSETSRAGVWGKRRLSPERPQWI